MAYTIKNADGSVLLNLVDGTTDVTTTSLTLIGKNTDAYGTALNTNLVQMLENFASTSPPSNPIVGQLWYSKAEGRLKVYTLNEIFEGVSAALLGDIQPTILKQGDLWIDTANDQLYFTKDGITPILVGPLYSSAYGKSGWIVETYFNTNGDAKRVSSLYSDGILLGMMSPVSFELATGQDVQGMDRYITAGITLNTSITGIRFAGTSTNSDSILGITPTLYLLKDNQGSDQQIIGDGALELMSDVGLNIGQYRDLSLYAEGSIGTRSVIIRDNTIDGTMKFLTIKSYPPGPDAELVGLSIKGDRVGILTATPSYNFHVEGDSYFHGDVKVTGSLQLAGTATWIVTEFLKIQDKNIELGYSEDMVPTELDLDGGGMTLLTPTPKTFAYNYDSQSWASNISINLNTTTSSLSYQIGGVSVLSSTTLGQSVIKSSIQKLGVLTELTVTNVVIKGSGISANTVDYDIVSISANDTAVSSIITVVAKPAINFLTTGTEIQIDGIVQTEYNNVYKVSTVTNITSTSTTFTIASLSTLTITTPTLGATPVVIVNDLLLTTESNSGGVDVTGRRIKNLKYSTVPTDAATVQFALDASTVQSLKGFVITLDITGMSTPNTEIATLLTALAPPINNPVLPDFPNETPYNLPEGYRARVLCQTNTVIVPPQDITVNVSRQTVQNYPDATPTSVISNVAAIASSVATTATYTYSVKEFRVISNPTMKWQYYRDITI